MHCLVQTAMCSPFVHIAVRRFGLTIVRRAWEKEKQEYMEEKRQEAKEKVNDWLQSEKPL
eukprot:90401-Rhodomonas_salina.2